MPNRFFFIMAVLVFCTPLFSQVAVLKIDKKHEVNVNLSTITGSTEIPERYIEENDSLYFILTPKGDWDFSKGDLKDLKAIKYKQQEGTTDQGRNLGMVNASNKINKLLIVFPRENIDLTKKFELQYDIYLSEIMQIPEHYWPQHIEFNDFYTTGKNLNEQGKYIEAYQQLENMLPGSPYYLQFILFSQYDQVNEKLLPEVIENYQNKKSSELRIIRTAYQDVEGLSMFELSEFGQKKDSVILVNELFDAYYRVTDPKNMDLRAKHAKLIDEYKELYGQLYDKWKKEALGVIETGFYQNENKYEIFIELLTRMLVYTNKVEILSVYDSINSLLVSDPTLQISFFAKHLEILEVMNWKEEFLIVTQLLNDEIKSNTQILGTSHLVNLRTNMRNENQPNYYIINAFNELVKGNFELFENEIKLAISKATDMEMIYYLELWKFSFRYRVKSAKNELIEKINAGLDFENKFLPNDAISQYEMAKRIDSRNALPPFLIGKIKLEIQNESFASERFFNESVNLYPQFALARIYHLELLISNGQYSPALDEIQAITNYPDLQIWYIFYLKAKLMFMQGQYKQALDVIETNCIPINAKNFSQHLLLGEIYMKLKDCNKAKENFDAAGTIDPNNPEYSEKMRLYILECNN